MQKDKMGKEGRRAGGGEGGEFFVSYESTVEKKNEILLLKKLDRP